MRSSIRAWLALMLLVSSTLAPMPLLAAETCSEFTWDVTRERALFTGAGKTTAAGVDSASAPLLAPGQLYALQLQPQAKVSFVTAPGRNRATEGSYAGLATLKIATPGAYRISADAALWIDVVADGGLMTAKAFQGAHDCTGPRKIVAFDFPVARQVTLQFSGAENASVRVSVTAADAK
jgi:hypothetical protein